MGWLHRGPALDAVVLPAVLAPLRAVVFPRAPRSRLGAGALDVHVGAAHAVAHGLGTLLGFLADAHFLEGGEVGGARRPVDRTALDHGALFVQRDLLLDRFLGEPRVHAHAPALH